MRRPICSTVETDNAEFVARIAKLPLAEQPGTLWDYGHSTDVLGRVIEVVSGKSLFQFEKERLLDPLGMNETAFYVAEQTKRPRIAEPMPEDRMISPTTIVRNPMQPRKLESGGGGMVGTIGDYARFAQMLLNGGTLEGRRYLKPETIALMTSDRVGPETGIVRDTLYYPGRNQRFRPWFCGAYVRPAEHDVAAGRISLGRRRAAPSSSSTRRTICSSIFMVQTPSQRGRIQLHLKTLIYQALGRG